MLTFQGGYCAAQVELAWVLHRGGVGMVSASMFALTWIARSVQLMSARARVPSPDILVNIPIGGAPYIPNGFFSPKCMILKAL